MGSVPIQDWGRSAQVEYSPFFCLSVLFYSPGGVETSFDVSFKH